MSVKTEALPGAHCMFPLGQYKGIEDGAGGPAARPFGLRFAVAPVPSTSAPEIDFSN